MKRPVGTLVILLCLALAFGAVGCTNGSTKVIIPPGTPTGIVRTTPCNDNTATFVWDSARADSGIDYYLVSVDSGDWVNIGNVTTYTLSSVIPNVIHVFKVKAVDRAGNEGSEGSRSFTTAGPTISSISAYNASSSTAMIAWTTDESTTSLVEYGSSTGYGSSSTLDSALVTTHHVTLTGLGSSTTYHCRVKSEDTCGNEAISQDYTFATTPQSTSSTSDDDVFRAAWLNQRGTGMFFGTGPNQSQGYPNVIVQCSASWGSDPSAAGVDVLDVDGLASQFPDGTTLWLKFTCPGTCFGNPYILFQIMKCQMSSQGGIVSEQYVTQFTAMVDPNTFIVRLQMPAFSIGPGTYKVSAYTNGNLRFARCMAYLAPGEQPDANFKGY